MSQKPIHVVFAEEDALFRLMEMGLRRALTPEGEKILRYFFGDEFSAPLQDVDDDGRSARIAAGNRDDRMSERRNS